MGLSRNVLMKILWPERGSLFAIVGGAIALSGDITSFFSEFLSPYYLLALFGAVSLVTALLCLQRASLAEKSQTEKLDDVVRCGVCDAMRFSLFSFGAFILLLMVGQGQTATETIGDKLGLIHSDVQNIQRDVSSMREEVGNVSTNVSDIHAVIASQKIIDNPQSGEEYFANVWTYLYAQRNTAKALEMFDEMYAKFSPQKMDAADLYFNTARPNYGRKDLIDKLVSLAEDKQDATLMVIAGRYVSDDELSEQYYARAREMDPELPFAYWDVQNNEVIGRAKFETEERKVLLEKRIADQEKFISIIENTPSAKYFYLPQYQPDYESMALENLENTKVMLDGVNKLIELQNTTKKR